MCELCAARVWARGRVLGTSLTPLGLVCFWFPITFFNGAPSHAVAKINDTRQFIRVQTGSLAGRPLVGSSIY
ncbi:hypothetical protein GGTG_14101 [Gaeumannomyces tritici R3-111a-1]|uniref:Uncharacterized protein n=1 Tax=Gaeumannomyces tritici (strain R3-111a-1) TaxID=644352 RepID=J3PKN8_GAET3|nr:hypothetical protein GGTG_14101 [Gaeumannomyces tritici R3-111a-1]EJT68321.1 hypothetical protein GGTG_14101 [Gaeumannomyces tritici R3-111a-1]